MTLNAISKLSVGDVSQYLKDYGFGEHEIRKFKDFEIDGTVIESFNTMPTFLVSAHESQIKFRALMVNLTGRLLNLQIDKPPNSCVSTLKNAALSVKKEKTEPKYEENSATFSSRAKASTASFDYDTDVFSDGNSSTYSSTDLDSDVDAEPVGYALPAFTPFTNDKLINEDCWNTPTYRRYVMKELSEFYQNNKYELVKSSQYKGVCLVLLSKYPKLNTAVTQACKIENTKRLQNKQLKRKRLIQPWRMVSRVLSKRMRNLRTLNPTAKKPCLKKKVELNDSDLIDDHIDQVEKKALNLSTDGNKVSFLGVKSPSVKRKTEFSLLNNNSKLIKVETDHSDCTPEINVFSNEVASGTHSKILNADVSSNNVAKELQEYLIAFYKNKTLKKEKIDHLIRKTFDYRRSLLKDETCDLETMFLKLPFLLVRDHLISEFELIVKSSFELIYAIVKEVFRKLWKVFQIKAEDEDNGNKKIITTLENKLKSGKYEPLILSEKSGDKLLKHNAMLTPRIYYAGQTKQFFIVYRKNTYMECDDVIDSVCLLFTFFFVFDLSYPQCFSQIMGFFHEKVFANIEKLEGVTRTTNYISLLSNLC